MSEPRETIASAANLSRREVDAILAALADSGWEIVRLEQVGIQIQGECPERMTPLHWSQERLVSLETVEDEGGLLPEWEARAEPVYRKVTGEKPE